MTPMQNAMERIYRGDPLSDLEIALILERIEKAVPFLNSHPAFLLCLREAYRLRDLLENWQAGRKQSGVKYPPSTLMEAIVGVDVGPKKEG